jgi:hypothetical protein
MLLQVGEWDDLEGPFVGARQDHVGGRAVLLGPQPVHCGDAPPVCPGEPVNSAAAWRAPSSAGYVASHTLKPSPDPALADERAGRTKGDHD